MKKLTCEICGGTDMLKEDDFIVCQDCGCKYTVEDAQDLLSEEVSEDTPRNMEKCLELARRAVKKGDWSDAEDYYEVIEQNEPENIEAIFYLAYADCMQINVFSSIGITISFNSFESALESIIDIVSSANIYENMPMLRQMNDELYGITSIEIGEDGLRKKEHKGSIYEYTDNISLIKSMSTVYMTMIFQIAQKLREENFADSKILIELYTIVCEYAEEINMGLSEVVDILDEYELILKSEDKTYITYKEKIKYENCVKLFNKGEYVKALEEFKSVEQLYEAKKYIEECKEKIYLKAMEYTSAKETYLWQKAVEHFEIIPGYKDSDLLMYEYKGKIEKKERTTKTIGIACLAVVVALAALLSGVGYYKDYIVPSRQYSHAIELQNEGKDLEAAYIFKELGKFSDSSSKYLDWQMERYQKANELKREKRYIEAIDAYLPIGSHPKSFLSYTENVDIDSEVQDCRTAVIDELSQEQNLEKWHEYFEYSSVALGSDHVAILKSDGTVVAFGNNDYGQCNVEGWTDIIEIVAGNKHTAGLKADGTVVVTGDNESNQLAVGKEVNVVDITASAEATWFLMADGSAGLRGMYRIGDHFITTLNKISYVGTWEHQGMCVFPDGSVVATGNCMWYENPSFKDANANKAFFSDELIVIVNNSGELEFKGTENYNYEYYKGAKDWYGIRDLCLEHYYIIGLRYDGTVVATGANDNDDIPACNVEDWSDVVEIETNANVTVGLRSDGTLLVAGKWDGLEDEIREVSNVMVDNKHKY